MNPQSLQPADRKRSALFHRRNFERAEKPSPRPTVTKVELAPIPAETKPPRKIEGFERQASEAVASHRTNAVQKFIVALIFSVGSMAPIDNKERGKLRAIIEAVIRDAEYAKNDAIAAIFDFDQFDQMENVQKIRAAQKAFEFCICHNNSDEIWKVMVGQPTADETTMSVESYIVILADLDQYRSRAGGGAK